MDAEVAGRLLGVIEQRCLRHTNGAEWQARVVGGLQRGRVSGAGRPVPALDRAASLHEMLRRYVEHMHSNLPVHDWPELK